MLDTKLIEHIHSSPLTTSDMVEACCTVAREQIELGDFDAGCAALGAWWMVGEWPRLEGLNERATADLLLVSGVLSGSVAGARRMPGGHRFGEALLSGAIAFFERLGERAQASEARIELAYSYYRQGLFEIARITLQSALKELGDGNTELKTLALVCLAIVERHSGHLHDALRVLHEAQQFVEGCGTLTRARFHHELATTSKEFGIAEKNSSYFEQALDNYGKALNQFEALGNRRFSASVENNHGYLLSTLGRYEEAETHLERARRLFDGFGDDVRRAQVDETLTQLYLSSGRLELAQRSIRLAVDTLENTGEDASLAEALTTQGLVLCRLGKRHEAKPILERAQRVASRCGDNEASGRALLILIEEMCEQLGHDERREIGTRASQLLAHSQQAATRERLRACLDKITAAHLKHEEDREKAAHSEKMAALGELSFGVAHNVNNALTGILGRAQLLMRTNNPEKITAGLELIIKSAGDGAHIIRRIQDFARQRPTQEFQSIAIAGLLSDAFEMTRARWETRPESATIRFALHADCTAHVMGDPVELREVLVNMVYNAVDAMPWGGEIRLSAHETADRVVVNIADTGTGMRPEVKTRLFDPFFTTKGKAGTGMGLAVSFGIIRRHDGSIEVDSELGRGTTFRISLPTITKNESKEPVSAPKSSSAAAAEHEVCVLVVDDEVAVREVLTETLEAEGCKVLVAETGQAGLRLYNDNEKALDAVFTDISMPEMGGWELIRAIRKRSETIPLAIVSGWADAITREDRESAKVAWAVSKPFDISTISRIANEITARKKGSASASVLKFPNPK